jgi:predicted ArsR family transcriptional regulator
MRIVKLLVGHPPQTVSDLIETAKITRTAITEQLNELVAAGFAERTMERLPGRGRPRHLYAATTAALLLLFASNQRLVVPAIWRAIGEAGGEKLTQNILSRVSAIVADHYKQRIAAEDPAERLCELAEILRAEGGLVEVSGTDEQLVMHKRSCAFISMLDDQHSVCEVDQQLLSDVVGSPVRRIACRLSGDPCCSFEICSSNGCA